MNFTFESVLTYDSETYNVKLEEKDIGTVLKDKQQGMWAAKLPNSQNLTSQNFANRKLAAEHLAKLAGLF